MTAAGITRMTERIIRMTVAGITRMTAAGIRITEIMLRMCVC